MVDDKNVLYLLNEKYPTLANYIKLIVERKNNGLIRESYLYMRLGEEFIIEILAKNNGLSLVEYNAEYGGQVTRSVYSLSEELHLKGVLKYEEKLAHDHVRKISNVALHRGVSERFLEQGWAKCYNNILFISSFLTNGLIEEDKEYIEKKNDISIYSDGDFRDEMEVEFGYDMEDDIKEANELILERVNFSSLKYEDARKIVDYYINSIHGGTLPILAARYAIKMSKEV